MFKTLPIQLKIASLIAAAETLVSAALTAYFVYGLASGQEKSLTMIVGIILLMLGTTIFLIQATRNLIKKKRWARSAIVFWQILQLSLGWGSIGGQFQNITIAATIFMASGLTTVLLFSKTVNELFLED